VPLSEHEQRLLDQIERALVAEDPKFASTVRTTDLKTHLRRRARRGIALFVLGMLLLLTGVIIPAPPVGAVGFVVMLLAALVIISAYRRGGPSSDASRTSRQGRPSKPTAVRPAKRSSFMERFEERWRKRWDERDR